MTTPPPTGTDADTHPAAAVAGLWKRVLDLAHSLDEQDWAVPTGCPGWDVKDLLGHLSGIQTAFDGSAPQPSPPEGWTAPEGTAQLDMWTEAAVAARRDWPPAQVLEELGAAARGHEARLRAVEDWTTEAFGPTGQTTEQGLFAIRCYDVWVHLQDLREAFGHPIEADDGSAAATAAYDWVLERVPWLFAKRVDAPDGVPLRLTLRAPVDTSAVLVRRDGRAGFDGEATDGGNLVDVAPAALTLMVSGRGDPQRWSGAGLLRWEGEVGEQFVQRARLFG